MMNTDYEIHPYQADILRVLIFQPSASFTELNTAQLPTDQLSYHINRLITLGIIEKHNRKYQLTNQGKEFANRFDTDSVTIEKNAKVSVLICPVLNTRPKQYLVQQRLKQPYFGYYGFITGKLRWGECVHHGALRELKEETGLTGTPTLVGIKHKIDYSPTNVLLEDKFFMVFRITHTQGSLITKFEGGENIWLPENKIMQLPNLFDGVDETIKMVNKKKLIFSETKYLVRGY